MEPRILLVDDDRLLREVIGDCLKLHNYRAAMAEDAAAALKLFKPGQYKLGGMAWNCWRSSLRPILRFFA